MKTTITLDTPTTRVYEAYLIDVAEIGAALGSGDIELGDAIRKARIEAHLLDCSDDHKWSAAELSCVDELLQGGALVEHGPELYVKAFSHLCRQLGRPVPPGFLGVLDSVTLCPSPFDLPAHSEDGDVNLIPALRVHDVLAGNDLGFGDVATATSIVTFSRLS